MWKRLLVLFAGVATALAGMAGIPTIDATAGASATVTPVGSFDHVSARFDNLNGLSGWAADPATPGVSIRVHVYIDGYFIGQANTGDPRPDVAAAMPSLGGSTGWHLTTKQLDNVRSPNPTQFCAYALRNGGTVKFGLGCHSFHLQPGPNPFNPLGALDLAAASPGLIQLRGWAGDPDGDPTTQLRIFYDGSEVLQTTASLPRPDVQSALGLSPTTGFNLSLPIMPGLHSICIVAQNTGNQGVQNTTVGCVSRTIPGVRTPGANDPRGHFDRIDGFNSGLAGDVEWKPVGWAYDPDAAGPITIRVRTLGLAFLDAPPTNVFFTNGFVSTGLARPDVQSAVPAAGPNAGFGDDFVPNPFFPVLRVTCVYAVNVGPGTSALLGCTDSAPDVPVFP
jgi:hypothetical protein